jgi:uncharacterized membrane protein (UPF0127 family)
VTRFACALVTVLAAVAVATAGCRGGTSSQAPLPTHGTAAGTGGHAAAPAPPTTVLPDGSKVTLELASTQEEISRGLMFRPSLAADRGMLFLFDQERVPSFWMKDTLIPLDIIFLDGTGRVVDMAVDAQPCRAEPCPQYVSKHPAAAVLEMTAGAAARHRLAVGDRLEFAHVPRYPRG